MSSLLERIEGIGAQPKSQQRGIEQLLRARKGKAGQAAGPAASGLRAQQAVGAGKQALAEQTFAGRMVDVQARGREEIAAEQQALGEAELRQQEQLTQAQLAQQRTMTDLTLAAEEEAAGTKRAAKGELTTAKLNHGAETTLRNLASDRNITEDNIFADARQENVRLSARKDAADLEAQAFVLAMRDRELMNTYKKMEVERGLDNRARLSQEMARVVFGDKYYALLEEIGFNTTQAADRRYREKEMDKITADIAAAAARAKARDKAKAMKWAAVSGGVTKIIEYKADQED